MRVVGVGCGVAVNPGVRVGTEAIAVATLRSTIRWTSSSEGPASAHATAADEISIKTKSQPTRTFLNNVVDISIMESIILDASSPVFLYLRQRTEADHSASIVVNGTSRRWGVSRRDSKMEGRRCTKLHGDERPGDFVPKKLAWAKVRGLSVDITTKGPDLIKAVWANSMPVLAEGVGFEPTIELPL